MSVGNNRASIFGVKEETVSGELEKLTLATQFIPLRPGFSMEYKAEELTNDELQSDIGMSKSSKGKESVDGGHDAFLKHSGTEGVAPQIGVLYKSLLGGETLNAVERSVIAGSTLSVLKVGVGLGVNFYKGQALLIKDATNNYSIRNVKDVVGDDIQLNFQLQVAPAAGVALGKAVTYTPQSQGFKTFSAWLYQGNGYNVVAAAGCTVTELSVDFSANAFGEAKFKYQGTKYYMNPVEITANNKYIDWTDDNGAHSASLPVGYYRNTEEIATALQSVMNDAGTIDFVVAFNSATGFYTISTSGSAVLSLDFLSGANTANSIAPVIGFPVADQTAAITYTSTSVPTYAASLVPNFLSSDVIVLKDAEFVIGLPGQLLARKATKATLKITKKTEDVDAITAPTGTLEKIASSREVTMDAEIVLDKHDVSLFTHLINNNTVSAMLNCGPRSAKNWVPGKCFNAYLPNAVVTGFSPSGDQFIIAKISLRGFIDNSQKDIFVNFI